MGMYKRCMHVEWLDTEEREGLLDNERIFVAAKVDGLNGCAWRNEDTERLACGSRSYELTEPGAEDNMRFRSWCKSEGAEQDALRAFCGAHPDLCRVRGMDGTEPLRGRLLRARSACPLDVFHLRCARPQRPSLSSRRRAAASAREGGTFPWFGKVLAMLGHPTMEDMLEAAKSNDFLLEGLGLVGEGAVLKMRDWRNECGRQTAGVRRVKERARTHEGEAGRDRYRAADSRALAERCRAREEHGEGLRAVQRREIQSIEQEDGSHALEPLPAGSGGQRSCSIALLMGDNDDG